jgi:hypothetical protein
MPETLKIDRFDAHPVWGACGFDRVRTNRRVTNLVASRYWPARGFELTQIRLVRRIPDV